MTDMHDMTSWLSISGPVFAISLISTATHTEILVSYRESALGWLHKSDTNRTN